MIKQISASINSITTNSLNYLGFSTHTDSYPTLQRLNHAGIAIARLFHNKAMIETLECNLIYLKAHSRPGNNVDDSERFGASVIGFMGRNITSCGKALQWVSGGRWGEGIATLGRRYETSGKNVEKLPQMIKQLNNAIALTIITLVGSVIAVALSPILPGAAIVALPALGLFAGVTVVTAIHYAKYSKVTEKTEAMVAMALPLLGEQEVHNKIHEAMHDAREVVDREADILAEGIVEGIVGVLSLATSWPAKVMAYAPVREEGATLNSPLDPLEID